MLGNICKLECADSSESIVFPLCILGPMTHFSPHSFTHILLLFCIVLEMAFEVAPQWDVAPIQEQSQANIVAYWVSINFTYSSFDHWASV